MATSYKNKTYTTLGTPTNITTTLTPLSVSNSSGVPVKDYTVKGKSIVWNQLVKNGNFVDKTGWSVYNGTGSVSNNKYTFTVTGTQTYASVLQYMDKSVFVAGHKYYVTATITPQYSAGRVAVALHNGATIQENLWVAGASSGKTNFVSTTFTISSNFVSGATTDTRFIFYCPQTESVQGNITVISNAWMVDLTKMFGAGNEPTSAQFRAMFPDDYYEYNEGELRSIEPTSVETKNQSGETKRVNIPSSKYFQDGMRSVGSAYDEINFLSQNAIKRIGVREYQTGDENNANVMTDKKNTIYELETPVETAIVSPLQVLSTFKGFTSFSVPNSLTQSGPFDLTYYAEGGTNPEKGWLTTYKRKIYTGKTVEWSQLLPDYGTVYGMGADNHLTIDGPSYVEVVAGNKYFFCVDIVNTEGAESSLGLWWRNTNNVNARWLRHHAISVAPANLTGGAPSQQHFWIYGSGTYSATNFMLFDLTKMFGAGNEPATPAEFWQYFDNKYYPYNAGETQPLFLQSRKALTYYTATTKQNDLMVDVPKKANNVLDYSKFNPIRKDKYIISSADRFIERTASSTYNNSLFYPAEGNSATLPNVNNLLKFENQTVTFSLTSSNTEVRINKYSSDGTSISTIVVLSNAQKSFTTTFSEITYIDIKANSQKPFYIRGLQVIAVNKNYVGLGDATSATILSWGGQSKVINGTLYSGGVSSIRVDSDNLITPLVHEVTQTTDKTTDIAPASTIKTIAKEHPNPIDVCFSLHTDGVEMNDSTKNNRIGLYSSYVANGTTYWKPECWKQKSIVVGTNDTNAFGANSWAVPYSDENVYAPLRFAIQGLTGGTVTAKDFALYENKQSYTIPTTVTSLPGYGIGIGDICNSVERYESGWRYVQRAASVRFTTAILETASETGTTTIDGKTVAWARNIQFPDSGVSRAFNGSDGWANISSLGDVVFNGTKYNSTQYRMHFMNYSSIEDVKTALGTDGVLFHYQIATPVVTDISDKIADSFLKDISVIPGGKVVMYNNYSLDVPSTVKWKF